MSHNITTADNISTLTTLTPLHVAADNSNNNNNATLMCNICGFANPCDRPTSFNEFILQGVLMNVINIVGIVCNAISIYILSQKQMRASINCCLIGLATFDILLLVSSVVVWGVPAVTQFSPSLRQLSNQVIPRVTPWFYPLATIGRTGSTYVTVTVTIERYVAVCHSLKARYICTYGRARLYMILISVFVLLYNVPKFLETEVRSITTLDAPAATTTTTNNTSNTSAAHFGYIACPTAIRNNIRYIEIYIMWMSLLVMYCVPFGILLVLNVLVYRTVRQANRMRQLLSRRQETEVGLATMLFAIVFLFLVCNSLSFIINVIELLNNHGMRLLDEVGLNRLTDVSNLLINISSSSNFAIYCIFGQKFRRLFLRLFCGRLQRRSCCCFASASASMEDTVVCPNTNGVSLPLLSTSLRTTPQTRLTENSHAPRVDGGKGQLLQASVVTRARSDRGLARTETSVVAASGD